jgi:hypothetical protein
MNKKLLLRIISTLLILAFALSTSAGGGGVRWKTIRVDAGATFHITNSGLKLFGIVPSIAYGADHLYYATLVDGDHFVTTIVDNNWGVGKYASLAIEPSTGHPRISYYDETNGRLKFAALDATGLSHAWTITTVDGGISDPGGNKTAIALENGTGLPHIAYVKLDGHVWHAWKTCSLCTWQKEELDSSVKAAGSNITLAIDTNNHLHMAYYDNDASKALYYSFYDGATWATEQVPDPYGYSLSGQEPSLALDGDDRPAIVYKTDGSINYAWKTNDNTPGDWSFSIIYVGHTISDRLTAPSLQLPNDDATQPRISFIDSNYHVEIAVFDDMGSLPGCSGTDGDYGCSIIDDTSTFIGSTSLAVEESVLGNINRLIYIDEATGELRYKFESSEGVWGSLPVNYSSNVGLYSSLAVDSTGPHISYYDRATATFKFAEIDNSDPGGCGDYGLNAWFRCDTVAGNGSLGSSTSMGIGYNDTPYIAYYNRSDPKLMYAELNPGWSSYIIDESYEDVGMYTSLAFDRVNSCGRIAYMDYTNGWLMYAEQEPDYTGHCGPGDTNWGGNRVEYISQDGFGISLAIDPNNIPLISFVDGEDHLVKVARYGGSGGSCDDNGWNCYSIAPGHPTEWGETSIWANDSSPAGTILVSFHDSVAATLMESTFVIASGWVHETVDDAAHSGEDNSITAIGVMPVIAYTDGRSDDFDLMLASRVGSGNGNCGTGLNWNCQTLDSDGWTGFSPSIQNISGRLYISYYDWTNGDLKLMFQAFPSLLPIIKKP